MNRKLLNAIKFGKIFSEKLKEDHVSAYSAMSSYFMIMSFVPFLMLLLSLAKYLPFTADDVMNLLKSISLVNENSFLQSILDEIFTHSNFSIMGLTIITLLWAASKGVWAMIQGFNSVYDIEESRNTLILRISAMFYTLALMIVIVITLILLVFSSSIHSYVTMHFPRLAPIAALLVNLRGFFSLFILTGFFLLLYIFIPARKSSIKDEMVGAVFASLGWSVFSFGFSIYVSRFSSYTKIYGSLGTILLFFLWLYMLMYIMFLGAEINFFLSEQGSRKMNFF